MTFGVLHYTVVKLTQLGKSFVSIKHYKDEVNEKKIVDYYFRIPEMCTVLHIDI